MRVSAAAMNAALRDFKGLQYSRAKVSMFESFLTAKWMEANGRYPDPAIADTNDAVSALFDVVPEERIGRLYPFRYDWLGAEDSGRKTVWNNTTRGSKLATSIFNGEDIRQGLKPNASAIVAEALADDRLPSKQALAALLLRNMDFEDNDDWAKAEAQLLTSLAITQAALDTVTDSRPLGVQLLGEPEWAPDEIPDPLGPPAAVTVTAPPATPPTGGMLPEDVTIVVDARTERMLRRSVERYPCILLVGPPGTGKGTLVRWMVNMVAANPGEFGFAPDFVPNPIWRTPDESWSAFDLVGGIAPDENANLVWSNGLLLDAVAEHRWLVLDETNRADLDKIMGPLLTWLSRQEVEVGRANPHGGNAIHIGWADSHISLATATDTATGEPTRYLAGRDWRLLGTYNPQDAQRVFRMGQALSRRFVVIPVPALSPGQFDSLLSDTYPELSDDVRTSIVALYSAHYGERETLLGPAIFLRLADYLDGVADDDISEQLAEAYVANVGKFISAFDDVVFDALGTRVVEDEQAMTREQWEWTVIQRQTLG
ncbi:MAG TPA: AAA family ATPase [Acidimicrobiia bacterium]|nr:AAA family ATPase [Acidimicrobiia bacterium]